MKLKKIIIPATAIVLLIAFAAIYVNQCPELTFSSSDFKESAEIIQNPYQGFYHMYGFSLSDDSTEKASKLGKTITEHDNLSLALLEINLKNFRDRDLSDSALLQLETLLDACQSANRKLILRFLYDWDGKAKSTEPDNISQIFSHMEQVAPFINSHKNTVYILQGIFVGNCGEMNNSNYMDKENMIALAYCLDKCIDKDIFLSVRTPEHYRIINKRTAPLQRDEAYSGALASRLSLFNDGMLGSDTDLGTYGTSSHNGITEQGGKGLREEEIDFQNQLCNFLPNGGECVIDNQFNDFNNALKDLNNMHVSYLNCDYDSSVLNKWRDSLYEGEGPFQNVKGYDYIAAHLGYRYVVTSAKLEYSRFKDKKAAIHINIKNTGFSPSYKKFTSKLLLNGASTKELEIDFDNRTSLLSNQEGSVHIDFDISSLEAGTYNVYLEMIDNSSNPREKIKFANENYSDEGLKLGTLTVK